MAMHEQRHSRVLQLPSVREALVAGGYEPAGSSAADMARTLRTESLEFAAIVRAAKIKPE